MDFGRFSNCSVHVRISILTDKVAIDQRVTRVGPPQLIKQNTHYESPAFGSQIEAILLKIKSKQENTDDGHLASVFFVLPGACSRGAADLLHHAVDIRHDVGPLSRHKHTLVLFPCHVQYLQHTLCRRVKQITVLIFPQYQAHLFSP